MARKVTTTRFVGGQKKKVTTKLKTKTQLKAALRKRKARKGRRRPAVEAAKFRLTMKKRTKAMKRKSAMIKKMRK